MPDNQISEDSFVALVLMELAGLNRELTLLT
jgi:hypothetical protein